MTPNTDLKHFDKYRADFKPYGLTCEMWEPYLMERFDRHNEIEINYFPTDTVTYLFQNTQMTIPAKRIVVFWGLMPHRIIDFQGNAPYYVCTIPLPQFLAWNLPAAFSEHILKCNVTIEESPDYAPYDDFLFHNWLNDANGNGDMQTFIEEIKARLRRLSSHYTNPDLNKPIVHSSEVDLVGKMAVFIAQNYMNPIQLKDVAQNTGIHPDYAGMLFKKAFGRSIYQQILYERIEHAKRQLFETDNSITEIAFDCGFSSINRFNAVFIQQTGLTPRAFRNLKYSR